jgi:hypothetical protein
MTWTVLLLMTIVAVEHVTTRINMMMMTITDTIFITQKQVAHNRCSKGLPAVLAPSHRRLA